MKLPVIKHLTQFIEDNDEDYVVETIETLEGVPNQNPDKVFDEDQKDIISDDNSIDQENNISENIEEDSK